MSAAQTPQAPAITAGADVSGEVTLGGNVYTIERISSRKSSRILALMKAIMKQTDGLMVSYARFREEYERNHFDSYDPVQLRLRYPAKLLVDPDTGAPIRHPQTLENGDPNPKAGEDIWAPSVADQITNAEWERSGGIYREPRSPSFIEEVANLFPLILDDAEENVYRLLGLFLMSNEEVKTAWKAGNWDAALQEKADWLLDETYGDELLELAVAVSERLDQQYVQKARRMGGRLGNLGRLAGMSNPFQAQTPAPLPTTPESRSPDESTDGRSSSTPNSSTSSQSSTDGPSTPSSTPPGTSPTNSSTESNETPPPAPPESTPTATEASPAAA